MGSSWRRRRRRFKRRHRTELRIARNVALALVVVGVGVAVVIAVKPSASPTDQAGTIPPASTQSDERPVAALIIGDSFAQGAGASDRSKAWPIDMGEQMDWIIFDEARGGTGYISEAKGCGSDECPNYGHLLPDLTAEYVPDVVLVTGGQNDGERTAEAQRKAIDKFFQDLRLAFPEATIVATNPLIGNLPMPVGVARMVPMVEAAVREVGGTFVDVGQPIIGHPELATPDSGHPNDAGHGVIALAVAKALGDVEIPRIS